MESWSIKMCTILYFLSILASITIYHKILGREINQPEKISLTSSIPKQVEKYSVLSRDSLNSVIVQALTKYIDDKKTNPCFKEVYDELISSEHQDTLTFEYCKFVDDEQFKRRIAYNLTHCHLNIAGRPVPSPCSKESTIQICLSQLTTDEFSIFTTFTVHVDTLCFYLATKHWKDTIRIGAIELLQSANITTQALSELILWSAQVSATHHADVLNITNTLASFHNDILFAHKTTHDMAIATEKEVQTTRNIIMNITSSLQEGAIAWKQTEKTLQDVRQVVEHGVALSSALESNAKILWTTSYYLGFTIISWFFSSTKITESTRLPIFFLIFLGLCIEIIYIWIPINYIHILSYPLILIGNIFPRTSVNKTIQGTDILLPIIGLRMLICIIAILIYIRSIILYKDWSIHNAKTLERVETNLNRLRNSIYKSQQNTPILTLQLNNDQVELLDSCWKNLNPVDVETLSLKSKNLKNLNNFLSHLHEICKTLSSYWTFLSHKWKSTDSKESQLPPLVDKRSNYNLRKRHPLKYFNPILQIENSKDFSRLVYLSRAASTLQRYSENQAFTNTIKDIHETNESNKINQDSIDSNNHNITKNESKLIDFADPINILHDENHS